MKKLSALLIALFLTAYGTGSQAQTTPPVSAPEPAPPENAAPITSECENDLRNSLNAGRVARLPQGSCEISEPVVLPAFAVIRGEGKAKSILRCRTPVGEPCLTTRRAGFDGVTPRVELHDFAIKGNGTKRIGIELLRARWPIIENVWIHDIGGIGLLIDGSAVSEKKAKGHFAEVRNLHVSGRNEVGVRIMGVSQQIMPNRHRFYSLLIGGSSVVGLDIGPWVDTTNFFGTAIQGVQDAVWLKCRRCVFLGMHIEGVRGNAITTFTSLARRNEFFGVGITGMRAGSGKAWATVP